MRVCTWVLAGVALFAARWNGFADVLPRTFRICTWNLEAYVDTPTKTRFLKVPESKAKISECLLAIKPDVLALQELGSRSAVEELRETLKREGLAFAFVDHIGAFDTNIHIAVLSRFPFTARRPHTNDTFLLSGRRFRVGRGFAELDIQVAPNYAFTLIAAHLKSKRPIPEADEAELRLEEAKVLREKIDARLAADPRANVVVVGDFNDTRNAASTKAIIGRGRNKLIDTRPAEKNGDPPAASPGQSEPRQITWTHYYPKDDTFSRIDYILLSPAMAPEWVTAETYVLAVPGWGMASDHRPIVATFEAIDR